MKRPTPLLVLLLASAACRTSSPTQQPAEPASSAKGAPAAAPKHADMIDLIDRFLANPRSVDPAPILDFGTNDASVLVVVDQSLQGVAVGDGVPEDVAPLLLAAFWAGNMREQLTTGTKGDAKNAGLVAVVEVYELLAREGVSVAGAAELAKAHAEGTLDAWIASHPGQ